MVLVDASTRWSHVALLSTRNAAYATKWKPSKETVEKNLMQKLGEAATEFEKAYNLMMKIIGDLEDNYYDGNKKEERKF